MSISNNSLIAVPVDIIDRLPIPQAAIPGLIINQTASVKMPMHLPAMNKGRYAL